MDYDDFYHLPPEVYAMILGGMIAIKAFRLNDGQDVNGLASACAIDQTRLSEIEEGLQVPDEAEIVRLSLALGVPSYML